MTKRELIRKYEQQKLVLEKRVYNHMQKFEEVSDVPIEKADIKKETDLSNKIWWLNTRIEDLEEKIRLLEESIPQKIKRTATGLIDSILTNFAGGAR